MTSSKRFKKRTKDKDKPEKTEDKNMTAGSGRGYSSPLEAERNRRADEITIYDPFTRKWYNIRSRFRFRW